MLQGLCAIGTNTLQGIEKKEENCSQENKCD
jgi:hypothetical protein